MMGHEQIHSCIINPEIKSLENE